MLDFKKNLEDHKQFEKEEDEEIRINYNIFVRKINSFFEEECANSFSSNRIILSLQEFIEAASLMHSYIGLKARKNHVLGSYQALYSKLYD